MINTSTQDSIRLAADLIQKARFPVVFSGAGISVPSGIPDFRSASTGLWTKSDPMEVASLSAFRHRPEVFFNWLRPLAKSIREANPNNAHLGLASLEREGCLQAVITQNIDGLHHAAGSREVVEVHGSMRNLFCGRCQIKFCSDEFLDAFLANGQLPYCPNCKTLLKPDIILFEEMLPVDTWEKALKFSRQADLFIVLGSSLEVTPASGLPLEALRHGAKLLINTMSSTYLDKRADLVIHQDVSQTIPAITALVLQK